MKAATEDDVVESIRMSSSDGIAKAFKGLSDIIGEESKENRERAERIAQLEQEVKELAHRIDLMHRNSPNTEALRKFERDMIAWAYKLTSLAEGMGELAKKVQACVDAKGNKP